MAKITRSTHLPRIVSIVKSYATCALLELIAITATWWETHQYGGSQGHVKFLPLGLVLKLGRTGTAHEAHVLDFISQSTHIPVPKVLLCATGFGKHYTLMRRVEGAVLQVAWRGMDLKHKTRVTSQLCSFVDELRALPPSDLHAVSGFGGAPCLDSRVQGSHPFGPFVSEKEFNDHLIEATKIYLCDDMLYEIRPLLSDNHRIVFTHGDLAPRNIIVDGDKIVAILDWEESGWYPEYWEYIKARHHPHLDDTWDDSIILFAHDYKREWMVDRKMTDYMVGAL